MGSRIFIVGVVALLLGVQLRAVDSVVLTHRASVAIDSKMKQSRLQTNSPYDTLRMTAGPTPKKTIHPPRWLGWAMLSVGAVLVFHGLTIRKL